MSTTGWIVLIAGDAPVYFVFGSLFFRDWDQFGEAIAFFLKPDLFSAARGEFWDDMFAELKLVLFLGCCSAVVWAEWKYIVLPHILPMFG